MKYDAIAEDMHFYDFVFYECEKKTMYIYCPNCRREYEADITNLHPVKWLKENYKPCDCFNFRGIQPDYKHSRYNHKNLKRLITVGEFEKLSNGDVALNVYWHNAEFGASNYDFLPSYDFSGYVFKREPIFTDEKVIEIVYHTDHTVTRRTSLYIPMCSMGRVSIGEWRTAKQWRQTFDFSIIEESVKELKGTMLEQYIPDIEPLSELFSKKRNKESSLNDVLGAWLELMHTKESVKKLWKAGYQSIVLNKTLELMDPRGRYDYMYGIGINRSGKIINYAGKTLEKILRVKPQRLDLLGDRSEIDIDKVHGAQIVDKFSSVEINNQNVTIALSSVFENLQQKFEEVKQPISKLFKYIRHQSSKDGTIQNVTIDYWDYLKILDKLNIVLTSDVLFPSNLKTAHDNSVAKFKIFESKDKNKLFVKVVKAYKEYAYSNGKFQIDVIGTIAQLNKEANKFHNCSAGYVDKIIRGNAVLFLIRDSVHPRKNVWMLEYNPKRKEIIQNRGFRNVDAPVEVKDFANAWLSHCRSWLLYNRLNDHRV